jgi:hypothetical protein
MQLRRPGQSARWRAAVFVAVIGLHFLAGLIILRSGTNRVAILRFEDAPLSFLSLSPESSPKLPVSSPASASTQNRKRPETLRDIDRLPSAAELEPNSAISLPFDLSTDADAAARRQSDREENERRWRNLAGPSESQLEWWKNNAALAGDHKLGDTEHAEGGELITWMNDKCYFTTHGVTTFGMPQTSQVCKDPPKPETELFKDMRKKLDAGAKGPAP